MKWVEKLKKKWSIGNNRDFILIMLVFSLAGSAVSFSRKGIFKLLHVDHAPLWVKIVLSLILIVPLYQFFTLFFGLMLGQFSFFLSRQKAIWKFMVRRASLAHHFWRGESP